MGRIVKRHMQANGDSRERAEARVAVNDKLNAEQVRGGQSTRGAAPSQTLGTDAASAPHLRAVVGPQRSFSATCLQWQQQQSLPLHNAGLADAWESVGAGAVFPAEFLASAGFSVLRIGAREETRTRFALAVRMKETDMSGERCSEVVFCCPRHQVLPLSLPPASTGPAGRLLLPERLHHVQVDVQQLHLEPAVRVHAVRRELPRLPRVREAFHVDEVGARGAGGAHDRVVELVDVGPEPPRAPPLGDVAAGVAVGGDLGAVARLRRRLPREPAAASVQAVTPHAPLAPRGARGAGAAQGERRMLCVGEAGGLHGAPRW